MPHSGHRLTNLQTAFLGTYVALARYFTDADMSGREALHLVMCRGTAVVHMWQCTCGGGVCMCGCGGGIHKPESLGNNTSMY